MWIEPKTNWKKTDYINAEDFNRIRGNIEYLRIQADKFFAPIQHKQPMPPEVNTLSDATPEKWNSIEETLQAFVDKTIDLSIGANTEFRAWQSYIDYRELNRVERACLEYYNLFKRERFVRRTLSFELGNSEGVKI